MAVTLPSMPRARDLRAALPTSPSVPARERLLSLDVFRGITVAGMLLVNDPGTWSAIYPPLEHAACVSTHAIARFAAPIIPRVCGLGSVCSCCHDGSLLTAAKFASSSPKLL